MHRITAKRGPDVLLATSNTYYSINELASFVRTSHPVDSSADIGDLNQIYTSNNPATTYPI